MVEATGRHQTETSGETSARRSVAQLDMLHSLAARLGRLNQVKEIGEAITAELKTLIDYHNCRVYLLAADGVTLEPIAFRGELTEYEGETYEDLVTRVGEGITGHVAETGHSLYAPDAREVPFAVLIPGTADVLESILAVPLRYGDRVIGVIVLSNLGYDQFDGEDMRLLEVLASHAAVAFENARLFQMERESAETSAALLGLSQALTGARDVATVLDRTVDAIPSMVQVSAVAAYVREPDGGRFVLTSQRSLPSEWLEAARTIDAETAARALASLGEPFVLDRESIRPGQEAEGPIARNPILVAPLRWEPDGFGALVLVAPAAETSFSERDVRLARGIADITSLALGSARRVHELERFHELVESLEATFWEADPQTLEFTFLSKRAALMLRGGGRDGRAAVQRWGDQILAEDRAAALDAIHRALAVGGDHSTEYRALSPDGRTLWLRDLIHVVPDPHRGTAALRGLMIDITERRRAEQALRRSERKYSEAFRREREAAQRLRALDEMKNTFLEAVSHDLRTPLTSILGSALTLEQTGMTLPQEDALDLVHRIAVNARKLERLLSDLLDLDRLQRGIITPQRRPTDLGALVRETVRASDLGDRPVEIEAESIVIPLDAAKVERIVENLLANAARHTPAGTRLWVRVLQVDEGALLIVEDEGPGVPEGLREAVFEPFRQAGGASNHSPGVGVGLSLVARFAELHGGRAWVEERPGGGASFRVLLPAA
ncbi:MAG TPA: GAF domain-containing protein [Actinomycetota bacterium]|nr:GAF domain-containing protein [Actinomycetota bacterium]